MNQFSCYDHYLYVHHNILNFTIVSDLVPVLEAIVEVTDWKTLGLELGLSHSKLRRIMDGVYDENDFKCKMIVKWLNTGLASWSSLVDALKSPLINKKDVAEQIIKDHPCKYIGI